MGVRAMVRAARRPPPSPGNHQDSRGARRLHLGALTPRRLQAWGYGGREQRVPAPVARRVRSSQEFLNFSRVLVVTEVIDERAKRELVIAVLKLLPDCL